MDWSPHHRRRSTRFTVAAITLVFPVAGAACVLSAASRGPISELRRARAFIGTFDRVLIAGFLSENESNRDRDFDLNEETARLLRMTLRSKASMKVIESQPVHVPQPDFTRPSPENAAFNDVTFWRRLGEEYQQPLILTGTVTFRRAGAQLVEHQVGPRAVTVWRPRFRLDVRLVFISGRTGEMLDSLSLGPVTVQATAGRTSALALYFELMDRLAPSVLAAFGHQDTVSDTSR
jgi:hypothetical protein